MNILTLCCIIWFSLQLLYEIKHFSFVTEFIRLFKWWVHWIALPSVKTAVKSLSKSLLTWIKCLTLPFVVVLVLLHRSEVALNVKYCFNYTFCLNQEEIKYIFFAFPLWSLYCRWFNMENLREWCFSLEFTVVRLVAHGQFQNMFFTLKGREVFMYKEEHQLALFFHRGTVLVLINKLC